MYTLMLINEFFKLTTVSFPNESLAKTVTKVIFNKNTIMKKSHEISGRNKGMAIEKAEVATTHEKIIFFSSVTFID